MVSPRYLQGTRQRFFFHKTAPLTIVVCFYRLGERCPALTLCCNCAHLYRCANSSSTAECCIAECCIAGIVIVTITSSQCHRKQQHTASQQAMFYCLRFHENILWRLGKYAKENST